MVTTRNKDAMSNEAVSITPKTYLQENSILVKINLEKKKNLKFDRKNVFKISYSFSFFFCFYFLLSYTPCKSWTHEFTLHAIIKEGVSAIWTRV